MIKTPEELLKEIELWNEGSLDHDPGISELAAALQQLLEQRDYFIEVLKQMLDIDEI